MSKRYYEITNDTHPGCKCEFTGNDLSLKDMRFNCGQKHQIVPAEFDSVEIREAIRVIDSNRDDLIDKVQRLQKGSMPLKERNALPKSLEKIYKEMNEAVKNICAQNDLYGYKFAGKE